MFVTYVEITSVLVANTVVTLRVITTLGALASVDTVLAAGVRSVGSGDGVGLPDIHLRAAGTELTTSSVLVLVGWVPSLGVGNTLDPLDVVGALGIAVTCI